MPQLALRWSHGTQLNRQALGEDEAIIALGSNLGASATMLEATFATLRRTFKSVQTSSIWHTEPVDCAPGDPTFANAVAWIAFEQETPESLHTKLRGLEQAAGRPLARVRNAPRVLDLDVIAFGTLQVQTAELTVPHPRATTRLFVMGPLAEICPWLVLPGQSEAAAQIAARLKP
jgi:2-amino-4-hydroxy-6-hydroxymethyldihydropteridine diphosphokinase